MSTSRRSTSRVGRRRSGRRSDELLDDVVTGRLFLYLSAGVATEAWSLFTVGRDGYDSPEFDIFVRFRLSRWLLGWKPGVTTWTHLLRARTLRACFRSWWGWQFRKALLAEIGFRSPVAVYVVSVVSVLVWPIETLVVLARVMFLDDSQNDRRG